MRYWAFLRGINVGGSKLKMTDLKKSLKQLVLQMFHCFSYRECQF